MNRPDLMDPVTGVVPADEFRTLAGLPHGQAAERIRQYDPLWQVEVPDDADEADYWPRWEVSVEAAVSVRAKITVRARSMEEAKRLAAQEADAMTLGEWDHEDLEYVRSISDSDVKPLPSLARILAEIDA